MDALFIISETIVGFNQNGFEKSLIWRQASPSISYKMQLLNI